MAAGYICNHSELQKQLRKGIKIIVWVQRRHDCLPRHPRADHADSADALQSTLSKVKARDPDQKVRQFGSITADSGLSAAMQRCLVTPSVATELTQHHLPLIEFSKWVQVRICLFFFVA